GAAHHVELHTAVFQLGHGIHESQLAAVGGGPVRAVHDLGIQTKLDLEVIGGIHGARFQTQDLAGAAGQVEHAAIAEDQLHLSADHAPFTSSQLAALVERDQVGVTQR